MAQLSEELFEALQAGDGVPLSDRATADPQWWPKDAPQTKAEGKSELAEVGEELSEYQERLFASAAAGAGKDSVLLILQGMDTAGKGGIVRHVLGLVDPQGVEHHSFKAPTPEEQAHDFLWRIERELPAHGMIGVFDRSHYEDVLIHRVKNLTPLERIEKRYQRINDFEDRLRGQGIRVLKVMLHISREEQYRRLMDRLENPEKHWKFTTDDVDDRLLWDEYQRAYEIAIERTHTPQNPWYIVPADQKWAARWMVAQLLLRELRGIDPQWPKAGFDVQVQRARLEASR